MLATTRPHLGQVAKFCFVANTWDGWQKQPSFFQTSETCFQAGTVSFCPATCELLEQLFAPHPDLHMQNPIIINSVEISFANRQQCHEAKLRSKPKFNQRLGSHARPQHVQASPAGSNYANPVQPVATRVPTSSKNWARIKERTHAQKQT